MRYSEIIVKFVKLTASNILYSRLLNICPKYFAARCCWFENLHSRFINSKWKIQLFTILFMFRPQMRGRHKLGANFGVVGKSIQTFLKSVHWSCFHISNGFLKNRQNTTKISDFRQKLTFLKELEWMLCNQQRICIISWHYHGIT